MDDKKARCCCFTGHRFLPDDKIELINNRLKYAIERLVKCDIIFFDCGGAIGFDQLAGFAVLEMKKIYPQIKLIMVLPCKNQDERWQAADRERYRKLLNGADKVVWLQEKYSEGCMLRRNRHLVDGSGVCVSYLTKNSGGTAYTVNYARQQGLKIINLAE